MSEMEHELPENVTEIKKEGPSLDELGLSNRKRKRAKEDQAVMPEGAEQAKREGRPLPTVSRQDGGEGPLKRFQKKVDVVQTKLDELYELAKESGPTLKEALELTGELQSKLKEDKPLQDVDFVKVVEFLKEDIGLVGKTLWDLGAWAMLVKGALRIKGITASDQFVTCLADLLRLVDECAEQQRECKNLIKQ
jgi:hypothetical protein